MNIILSITLNLVKFEVMFFHRVMIYLYEVLGFNVYEYMKYISHRRKIPFHSTILENGEFNPCSAVVFQVLGGGIGTFIYVKCYNNK